MSQSVSAYLFTNDEILAIFDEVARRASDSKGRAHLDGLRGLLAIELRRALDVKLLERSSRQVCICEDLMRSDARRHFRECPLRRPL